VGGSKHSITAHERRVKRLAVRYGLTVMKMQKPIGKALAHGGYRLREDETNKIVFGNEGYEFSADLEEVEAWLIEQTTEPED
jgi:hypothetical protein